MSLRLEMAYQRYHARNTAIAALTGEKFSTVKRYMERSIGPEVTLHCEDRSMVWVHRHRAGRVGLRWVGHVIPNFRWHQDPTTQASIHIHGWYTNDGGYSSQSGDGLCWGEVFQLPTRQSKKLRYVAGYRMGGDDYILIYLGKIYEEEREAARAADRMAERAAEEECAHDRMSNEGYAND